MNGLSNKYTINNLQEDNQKIYQQNAIPPDWDLAKNHALSRRAAKQLNYYNTRLKHVCPCCLYQIERQDVKIFDDSKQLAFLGQGFPLFYNYIKYCLFMLFTLMISNSMFLIILYIQGSFCTLNNTNDCKVSIWTYLSSANSIDLINNEFKQLHYLMQQIASICSFITHMILLVLLRESSNKISEMLDQKNVTPADYTILVSNIPKGMKDYKSILKQFFSQAIQGHNLKVAQIVLVYTLDNYLKMQQQISQKIRQYQDALIKRKDLENIQKIKLQLKTLEKKFEQLAEEIVLNQQQNFIGEAFVSFYTEKQKNLVLQHNKVSQIQRIKAWWNNGKTQVINAGFYMQDRNIFTDQAPEPKDIIWKNIDHSFTQKLFGMVKGYSLSVVVMFIVALIFYFLSEQKTKIFNGQFESFKIDNQDTFLLGVGIVVILITFVNVFNKFCVGEVISILTGLQKHITYSNYQVSYALKYSCSLFFTTALMTLIVQQVFHNNIYGEFGIIQEESYIFLVNAFFPPLVWLIDPWFLFKSCKRSRQFHKGQESVLTQAQANSLMEDPDYDQGKRYSQVLKTMWFSLAYTSLIPLGPLISFTGMILYYWTDKYVLLRKRTINQGLSSKVSKSMITLLQVGLIWKSAGRILFQYSLYKRLSYSAIVMLVISVLLVFVIPVDMILQWLFFEQFRQQTKNYNQAELQFEAYYATGHPILKQHSKKEILQNKKQMKTVIKRKKKKRTLSQKYEQSVSQSGRQSVYDSESQRG